VLKAVAHLADDTTQDVTADTQWTLSNSALAKMSSVLTPTDTTDHSSSIAHNTVSVTASPTSPASPGSFIYTSSPVVSTFVPRIRQRPSPANYLV
jgi:hypothetical protein